MLESWLPALGISALVMFMLYRRVQRLFTRQRLSVPRLVFRVALFGTLCATFFVVLTLGRGLAPTIGLVLGAALAMLALYLTSFESEAGEVFFTPNRYIGLVVLSLFIGRLVYRMIKIRWLVDVVETGGQATPLGDLQRSPLTAGILLVLLGYYFFYYLSVLIRGWQLRAKLPTAG